MATQAYVLAATIIVPSLTNGGTAHVPRNTVATTSIGTLLARNGIGANYALTFAAPMAIS